LSKKNFTDGLSDLFTPDPKAVSGRGTAFLRNPFEPSNQDSEDAARERKHSATRKNFTTDLDSLLEEALQEVFTEQTSEKSSDETAPGKAQSFHQQTHRKRPFSGLDFLIRRTVESSPIEIVHDRVANTKRLTVTFDKKKLEKLKKIARLEKTYLKDILGDIVAEYIKKYEQSKGESL
jgi:hypothetical protein